ncbi:hypothetical protein CBLAS_0900 [Campylobacter blaseri]|uniref:Uncharacterized protein n=2 Tax=Campylobacter blaseri TaxID=2042961 RepID=A0A2P8R2P5_9BACT|nr:hypothetical protein CQ405_03345 [Campylobacter blaseri]PSM54420.1 hypothetical protein CRN67_03345 [Campylobacter blaseri]QKF86085.1 hypothetical protein CBLAS_0900 [Campylobacter blaseri]
MCGQWIRAIRVRDEVLIIGFENMAAKEEFDNNKEYFLRKMRAYYSDNLVYLKSIGLLFRQVKSVCDWKLPRDEKQWLNQYEEKAKGTFENRFKNPELRAIFEDIREAIKKRGKDER